MFKHSDPGATSMNLQETLACFGAVIGVMVLIYLFCRCCRSMDPTPNEQNEYTGPRGVCRYRLWHERHCSRPIILNDEWVPGVSRRAVVLVPSANAAQNRDDENDGIMQL